jgi:Protein of unknown function (DUF1648)
MTTTSTDRRSRKGMGRWALTVGGFAVASVAIGTVLLASRWSQIPAIVATHWGPGGGVDATMSRSSFVLTSALLLLGLTAFFGLIARNLPSDGRRLLAATASGTAALIAVLTYGTVLTQAGLSDPQQAVIPAPVIVATVVLVVVAATALWRLNPLPPPAVRAPGANLSTDARTTDTALGERLAWVGRAAPAGWAMGILALIIAAATVLSWVSVPWTAVIPLAAGALTIVMLSARVVINDNGIRVASAGIPWLRVPLAEVREASGSTVTPFGDFGGIGMRYGRSKRGFVTRKGEALLLEQADGTKTYVSINHADQAAAVVNTLLRRRPRD